MGALRELMARCAWVCEDSGARAGGEKVDGRMFLFRSRYRGGGGLRVFICQVCGAVAGAWPLKRRRTVMVGIMVGHRRSLGAKAEHSQRDRALRPQQGNLAIPDACTDATRESEMVAVTRDSDKTWCTVTSLQRVFT